RRRESRCQAAGDHHRLLASSQPLVLPALREAPGVCRPGYPGPCQPDAIRVSSFWHGSGTASEPKDAPVSDVGSITQRERKPAVVSINASWARVVPSTIDRRPKHEPAQLHE